MAGGSKFPNLSEDITITIYNPKYNVEKSDYDESTVTKGRTRIVFELEGGKWSHPVVFEIDNGKYFATLAAPKREGYTFLRWDKDFIVSKGGVTTFKAVWLKKYSEPANQDPNPSNKENENNNRGNDNRYKPYSPRETNNGPSYVYNGRVITGDPNNNNTNIFNNTRPGLTVVDSSGRPIGLTGNGNGNVNKSIPKVDKDYPRSGESNLKMVVGIFIITILVGVMYIYKNKLKKIDRKSKRTRK